MPTSTTTVSPEKGSHTLPCISLSPAFESPVQTVHGWREEKRASQDSGQESYRALVSFFGCHICGIGIGPGHHEQELYVLPVWSAHLCLLDERKRVEHECLTICGGCANRQGLTDEHLAAPAHVWDHPSTSYTQIKHQVTAFAWFWQVLMLFFDGLWALPSILSRTLGVFIEETLTRWREERPVPRTTTLAPPVKKERDHPLSWLAPKQERKGLAFL